MGVGIFGNSEDFAENHDLEPSPDNSAQEPGQEGDESLGAGPDQQGEPEESQAKSPSADQGDNSQQGELILGKFKSYDDLAEAYKNLERRLGGQSQSQQNQSLQMAQLFQAMAGGQMPGTGPNGVQAPYPAPGGWWGQGPYMPQVQPQTPAAPGLAWLSPGMTMPQPQTQTQDSKAKDDDVDPNKWLEEFYEKGPKAVDARIEARARQIAEEMINQAAAQYIAPMTQNLQAIHEFVAAEATRRTFAQLAQQAAQGKDDFNDLRQDMQVILQEQPHLLYLAMNGQNPFEIAYQEAKRRREQQKEQEQKTTAQKKGAQMPRPSAPSRREPQHQDPEKAYVRSIFGLDSSGKSTEGIFGQIE